MLRLGTCDCCCCCCFVPPATAALPTPPIKFWLLFGRLLWLAGEIPVNVKAPVVDDDEGGETGEIPTPVVMEDDDDADAAPLLLSMAPEVEEERCEALE